MAFHDRSKIREISQTRKHTTNEFLMFTGTIRFAYPVERDAIYQIYNRERSVSREFPKENRFNPDLTLADCASDGAYLFERERGGGREFLKQ